jgi:hypothetical protein
MPQEVSVSYQAIKSKVYRLIDTLVVGDKSEVEVQESIRRWWELIHPADRPIAQKYLLIVLARSCQALDAIEEGLTDATNHEEAKASDSSSAKAFNRPPNILPLATPFKLQNRFFLLREQRFYNSTVAAGLIVRLCSTSASEFTGAIRRIQ